MRVTLDEIAEVQGGIQKQQKRRPVENKFPFLRVANVASGSLDLRDVHEIELFEGELERFVLRSGDLLVVEGNGSVSQLGRAARWNGEIENCVHQNHLIRVRPGPAISARFLELLWNSPAVSEQLRSVAASTSGLHTLSTAKLKRVCISLPPLGEQRRIVAALEEHLSKIESGERGLTNSARRSAQYRKLVADLATKGKLAEPRVCEGSGRELLESMRGARASRVKGRRLKPAPLGGPAPHVPEHWTVASLDEISELIEYGSSTKTSETAKAGDVPVLRMGNIQDGKIDPRVLKYIPAEHPDAKRYSLEDGDLLFNRTNSLELVGKSAVYREKLGRMAFASYLIRCRFLPGVAPDWVNLVINSPMGRSYVRSVATQQVGQANVNGTKLAGMLIPVPPEAEQRRILDVVGTHHSAALRLESEIHRQTVKAAVLRRSFLAGAFAGSLVSQDPTDDPADELLARIRAEHEATGATKARRRSSRQTPAQRKRMPVTAPASDAPPPPPAGDPILATATQPTLDLEIPS